MNSNVCLYLSTHRGPHILSHHSRPREREREKEREREREKREEREERERERRDRREREREREREAGREKEQRCSMRTPHDYIRREQKHAPHLRQRTPALARRPYYTRLSPWVYGDGGVASRAYLVTCTCKWHIDDFALMHATYTYIQARAHARVYLCIVRHYVYNITRTDTYIL
jgi:hypothetical protein